MKKDRTYRFFFVPRMEILIGHPEQIVGRIHDYSYLRSAK